MSTVKVNFNSKHLSKDDPLPPFNGKLRLYNMRFCPYGHRVILVLNAKNIDYEIVNIDLFNKPEWYSTKSVLGKLPALEIADGVTISESTVIAQYLDDIYPDKPVIPKDPVKKAFDQIIVEASTPLKEITTKFMKTPDTVNDKDVAGYFKSLDFIQSQLDQRGTIFLDGDEPGYADFMLWPWLERLNVIDDERIQLNPERYNNLHDYAYNMWKHPVVDQYSIPALTYKEIFREIAQGKKPNFDRFIEE